MRRRLTRLLDFVLWLYSPPVPAIDIGGALVAAGWCFAFWQDPGLLVQRSYRPLAILPVDVLIAGVGLLAVAHVCSLWWRRLRTFSCLFAGFVWIAAAAGFAAAHAWTAMGTYAVLGAGAFLAALYSEITRRI